MISSGNRDQYHINTININYLDASDSGRWLCWHRSPFRFAAGTTNPGRRRICRVLTWIKPSGCGRISVPMRDTVAMECGNE